MEGKTWANWHDDVNSLMRQFYDSFSPPAQLEALVLARHAALNLTDVIERMHADLLLTQTTP